MDVYLVTDDESLKKSIIYSILNIFECSEHLNTELWSLTWTVLEVNSRVIILGDSKWKQ
jgi:hypothetical protein